ncbi:MAG: hypothetical protein IJC91_04685 [Oscillospiraceae bacterium]|nr:hypothetical protein [Oscillospiraceae bacterium]MBQ9959142.1 hypothetical protein [Oscillospiraceae bacterium]
MKKYIAALLCALLCLSLCGCSEKPHDFRDVDWGMSQNQVCKAEGTDYLYADDTLLYFSGVQLERACELYYEFEDGGLVGAECKFTVEEGMILADFMDIYAEMHGMLTELYGEPLEADYRIWSSEADRAEHELDPEAQNIYWQYITYAAHWQTETSDMALTLDYKDLQINLRLHCDKRTDAE